MVGCDRLYSGCELGGQSHEGAVQCELWPVTAQTDIHAVCDMIKSWFRVLPGGLFPPELFGRILGVTGECYPEVL